LEGQRPRLTHFSTTGGSECFSDTTATNTPQSASSVCPK